MAVSVRDLLVPRTSKTASENGHGVERSPPPPARTSTRTVDVDVDVDVGLYCECEPEAMSVVELVGKAPAVSDSGFERPSKET